MKGFIYINLIIILVVVMMVTGVIVTINLHNNMKIQLRCDYFKAKYLAESGVEEVTDRIYEEVSAHIDSYLVKTKEHKLAYMNKKEKEYTPLDIHKYINKPFIEDIHNYNYKRLNMFNYVHDHEYEIITTYEPKYNGIIIESKGIYNRSKSKIQVIVELTKLEVDYYDENNIPIVKIKSPEIVEYKYIY
ncbi:hypothetical protein [Anaeromicrobium sediminis]|uniref:Uncharacterized protein n=1 Tax=Anaeromicrobium sediminis TaxID=1478221 RepID=A0A267MNH7_9FIRM|nr:hypothetical protein [Anaeromicrobium sediminis]PAB60952.1 hypothetical protein CCE28_00530 [Anaeromicrobium sediminis]